MTYAQRLAELLQRLAATQGGALDAAAERMADALAGDGLVHLLGSGHSTIPVLDAFPRYGGYVGLHPLLDPRLLWHSVDGRGGVREMLWLERTEGYIERFLAHEPLAAGDALVIISHSGRNAVPVEAAAHAGERGLAVVGVTSLAHADQPATHSSGRTLPDLCDVVIDTGVPRADAVVEIDGWPEPVAGASTAVAVACVQELTARTAARLAERGVTLPTFVAPSARREGSPTNDDLFRAHAERMARRAAAPPPA